MNLPEPTATPSRAPRTRSRRSARLNHLVAGVSWALGAIVLLLEIWGWLRGYGNAVNFLNTVFVVIGTGLGGLLALSGDGDVLLFTAADEGQRDAMARATVPAFSIAFWGLAALWIAYQLRPDWRASADIQIGVLLILIITTYAGGYLWRRHRG